MIAVLVQYLQIVNEKSDAFAFSEVWFRLYSSEE